MAAESAFVHRRAERRARLVLHASQVLTLALLPALAWTATVPHADFQAGDPVRASEINENFAALADAITALEAAPRGAVLSDAADFDLTVAEGSQPVPGLALDIDSGAGPVKLELTAAEGGGMVRLVGAGYAWIVFRRSPDGSNWTNLTYLSLSGEDLGVPPGTFTFFDEPGPGTWHYDVHAAVFQSATLELYSVRFVGQPIGGAG